ncbi:MAG: hypothetical protein LBL47_03575 [Lactobacillus sp.]|jgi:hypothetical protein|nr:hypothetical protein [Lactobacillus sp.]
MKKLFYIVLLVVVVMVAIHLVKNHQANKAINEHEVITTISVDENGNIISEESIIGPEDSDSSIETIEELIEEDIVEENPDATADDHETIIEE